MMKRDVIAWVPCGPINIASARLRAYRPLRLLKKKGWKLEIYNKRRSDVYKAVIFQKNYSTKSIQSAKKLKQNGVKVLLDLCDNHFLVDQKREDLLERKVRLDEMVKLSDIVIASSDQLAEVIEHDCIFQVDDFVELPVKSAFWSLYYQMYFHIKKKHHENTLKVIWFGNAGHVFPRFGLVDLAEIIPVLNQVCKNISLSLTVVSNSHEMYSSLVKSKANFQCIYFEWNERRISSLLSIHDLCLIPAEINEFTSCKTANRVATALLHDVPAIVTMLPSYREFQSYVFEEDWENSIRACVDDHAKTQRITTEGKQFALEKFSEENILSQWEAVFNYL